MLAERHDAFGLDQQIQSGQHNVKSRFNFCKRHNGFSRDACIRSGYSLWFEDSHAAPRR